MLPLALPEPTRCAVSDFLSVYHLKEMCCASVEKVARLVFQMSEAEMKLWVEQNKHTLSLAERLYIDEAQNIAVIESPF
jgi:hypothetical protein